jgi:hypothetical protein
MCPSRHQRIQSRLNHFSYVAIGRHQELSERSVQFFRRKHSPSSINAFPSGVSSKAAKRAFRSFTVAI